MTKADLFNVVMDWRKEVDELMKKFKVSAVDTADRDVGRWLADVRRDGIQLPTQPGNTSWGATIDQLSPNVYLSTLLKTDPQKDYIVHNYIECMRC